MTAAPLITLTTDFGEGSAYVAAMKGVILSLAPQARVVDLTHAIPAQNVLQAAHFCEDSLPYFPRTTIHVLVIDPGVGTDRALLHIEAGGHHLLAPDNGCWTPAARKLDAAPRVRALTQPQFWRQPVSATFHGRDILAPVAAQLSLGLSPDDLGPIVAKWVALSLPEPILSTDRLEGVVLHVDTFGNLITNIPGEAILKRRYRVNVESRGIDTVVRTYGEAAPGTVVVLVSSSGKLEIAVALGNAATTLGAGVGARVVATPL